MYAKGAHVIKDAVDTTSGEGQCNGKKVCAHVQSGMYFFVLYITNTKTPKLPSVCALKLHYAVSMHNSFLCLGLMAYSIEGKDVPEATQLTLTADKPYYTLIEHGTQGMNI